MGTPPVAPGQSRLRALFERYPALPYVAPFVAFMVLLALGSDIPGPPRVDSLVRVGVPALLIILGRDALSLRIERLAASIAIGILVFVVWVGPDQLFPGYHSSILFENSLTGTFESTLPPEARTDPIRLGLRLIRATLVVPIAEELFWRGWLPRWLDHMHDFRASGLGSFTRFSFLATAVLFGVEHGVLWDVGLVAGLLYNGWMMKTRSLGDLIVCHAVTNGCLAAWVLATGQWEYW